MSRVAVLGAGVIGLSTAVATQRRLPWLMVTLISDGFSPDTTGDGSAGLWEPYLLGDTPKEDVLRWAGRTYAMFRELWQSPLAGEAGVSLVPILWLTQDKLEELPIWRDLVLGFSRLDRTQLDLLGEQHDRTYNFGFTFMTFTCEPTHLLPLLMKEFKERGGIVKQEKVDALQDLAMDYDVIINCTGIAARKLANDPTVLPIRGQVMRVKAPWVRHVILDDSEHGNYIIPNKDSVVMGGTHQEGDWNTDVCPKDREFIEMGCRQMLPGLSTAKTIKEWVGLRPGRSRVRLERETLKDWRQEYHEVIHNYGHGGSGVTLCWGCAQDAVDLIEQIISERTLKAKL